MEIETKQIDFTADYHIHTKYSLDCEMEPALILNVALKRGLRKIAVTDHNTIRGAEEVRRFAENKNIEVIVGAEILTDQGEITGLYLSKEIKSSNFMKVIEEIKRQNGKVMVPHPFCYFRSKQRSYKLDSLTSFIDFLEVYNGRDFFSLPIEQTLEIARGLGAQPVTGSDAHFYLEIGNNRPRVFNFRGRYGFIKTGIKNRLNRRHLKWSLP